MNVDIVKIKEYDLDMIELTDRDRHDVEALWNFHTVDGKETEADLLLVLGSHDIRVADFAAELFLKHHIAPLILVTGGAGKVTKNEWSKSEAEVYASRMNHLGVPKDKILIEDKSSNTGDNFAYSRILLTEKEIFPKTGVVVSKPYMARRALATATKRWPEVTWSARPPEIAVWDYPTEDVPLARMINLMVGDLQRLRVYADHGFQSPVDIPSNIWQAYKRLVDRGYDKYVIQ